MDTVEVLAGCRLKAGSSAGVAWDGDRGRQPNGNVFLPHTLQSSTSAPHSASVLENHSSLSNDDDDNADDDWTRRRPESVWLDYLYSWNPLAAGSHRVFSVQASSSSCL